ncbi:MAG: PP2C family protein-serine/threonine phosphatase [Planctomycetota bacterium]|jgi:serine phosphatase RsbU (regulator of sigma subunit)
MIDDPGQGASPRRRQAWVAGLPHPPQLSHLSRPEDAKAYDDFVRAAQALVEQLRQREEEFSRLIRITEHINYGVTLEEVLESLYQEMKQVIPYNRIGLSLIDPQRRVVVARWARSDRPMHLKQGYEAKLEGSTLQRVMETMQPRIINDLDAYLQEKPKSKSSLLITREGMRSSLTCPLIILGKPVGFLFFSSVEKGTYGNVHVDFFLQIAGQLASIVEKGRLYSDLAEKSAIIEKQNEEMTRDLRMARHVQRALIPGKEVNATGLDISFEYEPAIQVGGDVLDIVASDRGRVLFFVGDAMGHGVQAALVMSVVKAALHSAAQVDPRPASVLGGINKLMASLFDDRFVTAACCLVDPGQRNAELAVAGHPGPLWFRAASQDVARTAGPSLPLGIDGEIEYQSNHLALSDGDVLLFSTDGIVEAFDPSGRQYGEERLKAQIARHAGLTARELCTRVRRDLTAHCRGLATTDDLTLLVLKVAATLPKSPSTAS